MKYLGSAISEVIESNGMTAKEFAARAGLLKSNLSHIISGRRDYVGPKLVGRMAASLDPKDAESILEAYLRDEFNRVIVEAQRHGSDAPECRILITWS